MYLNLMRQNPAYIYLACSTCFPHTLSPTFFFFFFFLLLLLLLLLFANKIRRFGLIFESLILDMKTIEMPGLMASVAEFSHFQPLHGARIIVSSHMTTATAFFIETLTALGAQVRSCSPKIFSTHDHAAERALDWGPDLIVDYGGNATLLIHEGVKAEEIFANMGQVPDTFSTDNSHLQIVQTMIRDGLKADPKRYHKIKERLVGVSVESTDSAKRLLQLQSNRTLLFSVINISDSVTESKYGNFFNFSLSDMMEATDITTISGKRAVVNGLGDDGSKLCAKALKQAGAVVDVYEVDPNLEVQARLGGFSVIKTLDDDVVSETDIFVISKVDDVNVVNRVKKMKNNAIIYIIDDAVLLVQCFSGMKRSIVNPQTDKWVFPGTKSSIIVYKGYPSFMLSWYYTSLMVALLDSWSKRGTRNGKYDEKKKVYGLPEHLEEKVCALHLAKFKGGVEDEDDDNVYDELMEEQGNNVFFTTSAEPKKSDHKKGILQLLLRAVTACSFLGIVAFGLSTASKVKMELSISAVWG